MALNTEDNHAVNCRCKRGGGGGRDQVPIKYKVFERASCKSTWSIDPSMVFSPFDMYQ